MELLTTYQYNQGIGKHKLLSSTAGVGSIITTTIGYYILVSDINKWEFVKKSLKVLEEIRREEIDNSKRYEKAKNKIPKLGISFINDKRFVEFLKLEKNLPELICLIGIPSISLNEQFNTPNWHNHPINKLLEGGAKAEEFMVKGTHFPKWFINGNNELKTYSEWKALWVSRNLGADRFVPPRDALRPIKDSNGNVKRIIQKNENQGEQVYELYGLLSQTNLILICPNGHLSDIPWPKYLRWKTERSGNETGDDLFMLDDCCPTPKLEWTESKTKSEGYSSIYIECKSCGCGSGNGGQLKINLEGINNLKPLCPGHKPWEIDLSQDNSSTFPFEQCYKKGDRANGREHMQVALVTGNNVYYSNGFSSLLVPQYLAENKRPELIDAKVKCNEKYAKYVKVKQGITKEEFWKKLDKEDFIIENGFQIENIYEFLEILKVEFLESDHSVESADRYELYRWQEYQCFSKHNLINDKDGLKFNDIELPKEINKYFKKIQQVQELTITQIQLDFTRIKPKERIKIGTEIRTSAVGKNIFSCNDNDLFVLPANETYGEGLFFQFRDEQINYWIDKNLEVFKRRFESFLVEIDLNSQGSSIKQQIKNNGFKHFLIHTFSHILMKELEFSCGYPTASLKERLYISDRMSGVLIYTAEGSEGSMGGLVWQGQSDKIVELILKGLQRAVNCTSDPLCWESEGQGVFDLNISACFSCSLVSETSCEEMNLGLDRRVLIDEEFGYFDLLTKYNI